MKCCTEAGHVQGLYKERVIYGHLDMHGGRDHVTVRQRRGDAAEGWGCLGLLPTAMMTEVLSRASGEHGPACQASRDDRTVCVVVTTPLWELCKAAQETNMAAIWFCSFWLDLCPHPTPGRSSEHTLCLLCPEEVKRTAWYLENPVPSQFPSDRLSHSRSFLRSQSSIKSGKDLTPFSCA